MNELLERIAQLRVAQDRAYRHYSWWTNRTEELAELSVDAKKHSQAELNLVLGEHAIAKAQAESCRLEWMALLKS